MNPVFPLTRGVAVVVEVGRPLQKPEDVYSFLGIRNGSVHDGFDREGADLHLDGDWNAIDICAHVWTVLTKRALQSSAADAGLFQEGFINLNLAASVFIALALGIVAGDWILVGEVVDAIPAGFENHRVTTFEAVERAVGFRFQVSGHGLSV